MAVSSLYQGEGLMNEIVTHLISFQYERGNTKLFLYTKCSTAKFFSDLGFHEIARVENELVFMENDRTGFERYLENLKNEKADGNRIAAIVMNANPFTLGHRYLVECAAKENDIVHLFVLSEDASLVPFSVRKKLVQEGTADLKNVILHDSGSYIISNATFPSYFQKDSDAVIHGHAMLDITVFAEIAQALNITRRYAGEEPKSHVTSIYNAIMQEELPKHDIACIIVPRKTMDGNIISASDVRTALQNDDLDLLKKLVPASTYTYFTSEEAKPLIGKIKAAGNVVHY